MRTNNPSFYAQGEVCPRGRKFASYVLDFLTSLIISVLFFTIAESIMNATPLVKDYRDKVVDSYSSLIAEIENTGIAKADENENILPLATLEENYMKGAVLHSLKENNVDGISIETYKDVEEITADNDYAYSYFVTFKSTHIIDYMEESKQDCGWKYYTDELIQFSDASYFVLKENQYPMMTLSTATAIDNYFRDASYSVGSTYYQSILSSYSLLLEAGIKDVQNNYQPYVFLFEGYQNNLKNIYRVRYIELLISYVFALFFTYFLIPLLFKNGQTLAMKILKIGATDKNGNSPAWYQLLIKYGVNIVEYFLIIPVVALLFYGPDGVDIIASTFFWNISYLSLGIFSMIFMVLSFVLTFCLRKTKQSISEYLSSMIVKDSEVYVVEETLEGDENGRTGL